MSAAIEILKLEKSYGSNRALAGVDLSVPNGGVFGVVGPNGAGKTTLFSVISGFLRQDSGSVTILGTPLEPGFPPPPGSIGVLPQDASFIGELSLGWQMAHFCRLQGLSVAQAKAEVERTLTLVGLPEVARKRAKALSHGMLKRVGIAQALLGNPAVVILDEPTAGLDPHAARGIHGLIRSIGPSQTVVVSSHNLAEIESLCAEVAILDRGTLVRQDHVGRVVGSAAVLMIRLSTAPSADQIEQLCTLPAITAAKWLPTLGRLQLDFDAELTSPGYAASDVARKLTDLDLPFVEIQVGKSLEDRFVEETGLGMPS
ncbi:MAG: ABC transporter ATP-binding protein [Nannocystales bacterium]